MSEPVRLSAEEVYNKVKAEKGLLVCAYNDLSQYELVKIEFSIPLSSFLQLNPETYKDKDIIFYCA
ncbi:MAG: ArsR family transcriptional regulator [Proteobacteria bacterium]|nr:ArsR family transcriptional regulator [Pseudomonadota bacterium]